MRRVLVTGGAGFIGAHLVRALIRRGDSVRIIDNLVTGSVENIALALAVSPAELRTRLQDSGGRPVAVAPGGDGGPPCEVIVGDIRDPETMARGCREVEVVFHQGALRSPPRSVVDPVGTTDVNVTGTLRVLEAARANAVRRVVFASSSSVYGDTPLPKHEQQVPQPKSPYAASKLAGEAYCQVYSRVYGLSTVALRYFNVFGPWQDPASEYAAVIPKFITLALRDEPLPVHGDGLQSRDFTYVENVVEANLLSAEAPDADGAALNIGGGERHSLMDLIEYLGAILGRRPRCEYQPPRAGDVRHTEADISLARRLIGYQPRVDFETGLRATVASLQVPVGGGAGAGVAGAGSGGSR